MSDMYLMTFQQMICIKKSTQKKKPSKITNMVVNDDVVRELIMVELWSLCNELKDALEN